MQTNIFLSYNNFLHQAKHQLSSSQPQLWLNWRFPSKAI